jgi:hypothetical protein
VAYLPVTGKQVSDFAARMPLLLPRALAWAEEQSRAILAQGQPLNVRGLALARAVGVAQPERIRVWTVPSIPAPGDQELKHLALEQHLIGPGTHGLTLGYGIFILEGQGGPQLLSHECRHVYQVEAAGSVAAFLPIYLKQLRTLATTAHRTRRTPVRTSSTRGLKD